MRPRPVCGYTAMLLIWYLTTIRRYAARNTQVLYTALVSCIALKSHRKRCEIRDHDGSVDGLARLQLGPFRIAALVGEAKPGRAVCVAVRRRGLVDLECTRPQSNRSHLVFLMLALKFLPGHTGFGCTYLPSFLACIACDLVWEVGGQHARCCCLHATHYRVRLGAEALRGGRHP